MVVPQSPSPLHPSPRRGGGRRPSIAQDGDVLREVSGYSDIGAVLVQRSVCRRWAASVAAWVRDRQGGGAAPSRLVGDDVLAWGSRRYNSSRRVEANADAAAIAVRGGRQCAALALLVGREAITTIDLRGTGDLLFPLLPRILSMPGVAELRLVSLAVDIVMPEYGSIDAIAARAIATLAVEGVLRDLRELRVTHERETRDEFFGVAGQERNARGTAGPLLLRAVAAHCPELRFLEVHLPSVVDAKSVHALLDGCDRLEELTLHDGLEVTAALAERAGRLRGGVGILNSSRTYIHASGFLHNRRPASRPDELPLRRYADAQRNLTALCWHACHPPSFNGDNFEAIVKQSPALRHVELTLSTLPSQVEAIAQYCQNLTHLRLSSNHIAIPADLLVSVAVQCPLLTEVIVDGCVEVTDDFVVALATNAPGLRRLALPLDGRCGVYGLPLDTRLTDRALLALAAAAPKLESLSFTAFSPLPQSLVTDAGLAAVGEACGNTLRELVLANDARRRVAQHYAASLPLTTRGALYLAAACPGLMRLTLAEPFQLRDAMVPELVAACPRLRELIVTASDLDIATGLPALARGLPELRRLHARCTRQGRVASAEAQATLRATTPHIIDLRVTNT